VHTPFDPRATKEAAAAGLEVVMLNGAKLGELTKYLSGKSYKGTRVR
jgi:uridylate kinase